MAEQAVTLHLPDGLYERLKRQAEHASRTLEEEALDLLASAMPGPVLSDDLAVAVAQLAILPDEALWKAARSHLPQADTARLERLHGKRQAEGLDVAEEEDLAGLVRRYERAMLVHAHAARLLKERGCDVAALAPGR